MRAISWEGKGKVSVSTAPDPKIVNPHDAIVRVTLTAICGSDLHIYGGYIPTMKEGDVLGHEFMGEVVEVGNEVRNLRKGDRVVVPFAIACGRCFFCRQELGRYATTATLTPGWRTGSTASQEPGCLAILTSLADTRAVRRNTCGFHLRM